MSLLAGAGASTLDFWDGRGTFAIGVLALRAPSFKAGVLAPQTFMPQGGKMSLTRTATLVASRSEPLLYPQAALAAEPSWRPATPTSLRWQPRRKQSVSMLPPLDRGAVGVPTLSAMEEDLMPALECSKVAPSVAAKASGPDAGKKQRRSNKTQADRSTSRPSSRCSNTCSSRPAENQLAFMGDEIARDISSAAWRLDGTAVDVVPVASAIQKATPQATLYEHSSPTAVEPDLQTRRIRPGEALWQRDSSDVEEDGGFDFSEFEDFDDFYDWEEDVLEADAEERAAMSAAESVLEQEMKDLLSFKGPQELEEV